MQDGEAVEVLEGHRHQEDRVDQRDDDDGAEQGTRATHAQWRDRERRRGEPAHEVGAGAGQCRSQYEAHERDGGEDSIVTEPIECLDSRGHRRSREDRRDDLPRGCALMRPGEQGTGGDEHDQPADHPGHGNPSPRDLSDDQPGDDGEAQPDEGRHHAEGAESDGTGLGVREPVGEQSDSDDLDRGGSDALDEQADDDRGQALGDGHDRRSRHEGDAHPREHQPMAEAITESTREEDDKE